MSSPLLEGLNPQQLQAVTLPHQSALVLAGAGSGKTRVLTTRIAWLLETGQAGPANILAVTFTNKAAREMLTRIAAQLRFDPRGMWVGTFHGLSHRLLRQHFRDVGLPQSFQILDSADQQALVKRVLKSMGLDEDHYPARQATYWINGHKEAGVRPDGVVVAHHDSNGARLLEVYHEYERQCTREGVVDFAELLLRSYELLAGNAALRSHYRERFRTILVDEFQDTNRLQYAWLQCFAGPDSAVLAVGDDDQSIYAFRGADVGNMNDFQRDFAKGLVIRLEQNYRSHANILDAANALIRQNSGRLGKELWTEAGAGELLRLYEADTDHEEAQYVVDEVRSLHRQGLALADMALLYRSNAQSRVLEHACFQAGLAYRVYGGLRFFERQEIKHALAYLRLVANSEDDGAFLRVVNVPARGIGARTVESIQNLARQNGCSLWQAACSGLGGRSAQALAQFVGLIEQLRLAMEHMPLAELATELVERSGLCAMYEAEKDGEERRANLDELVNAIADFERGSEIEGEALASFLAHAALESGERQAGIGEDALQMMTVHSAKGLEFRAVFITGLEEGLFPHDHSVSEPRALEEERRLMYVAITRARERLYLTHAAMRMLHGQTRMAIPSRFLRELPQNLLLPLKQRQAPTPPASFLPRTQPASRSQRADLGVRLGQNVQHPSFGEGVIIDIEGDVADAKVQVNFGGSGIKWLSLRHAPLTLG